MYKLISCWLVLALTITVFPVTSVAKSKRFEDEVTPEKKVAKILKQIEQIRKADLPEIVKNDAIAKAVEEAKPDVQKYPDYLTKELEKLNKNTELDDEIRERAKKSFVDSIKNVTELIANYNAENFIKTFSGTGAGKTSGKAEVAKAETAKPKTESTPNTEPAVEPGIKASVITFSVPSEADESLRVHVSQRQGKSLRMTIKDTKRPADSLTQIVKIEDNNFPNVFRFNPPLVAGERLTFEIVDDKNKTELTESVQVASRISPMDSGLFGAVFSGVVVTRQAQKYNQADPFLGFQAGWGSRVRGIPPKLSEEQLAFIPTGCSLVLQLKQAGVASKVVLEQLNAERNLQRKLELQNAYDSLRKKYLTLQEYFVLTDKREKSELSIPIYGFDYFSITAPDGTVYKRTGEGAYRSENGGCTIRLAGRNPLINWKTGRLSIRFQGLFSSEGRAAMATPIAESSNGGASTPVADLPKPFPFIDQRTSFSPEFTAWYAFRPLGDFSVGPYITIGGTNVLDQNEGTGRTVVNNETNRNVFANVTSRGGFRMYYEAGMIKHLTFTPSNFFLQSITGYGYYEGLRGAQFAEDGKTLLGRTHHRFIEKVRIFPQGFSVNFGSQIKAVPMFGIDANIGKGPDNIRFFTGFILSLRDFNPKNPIE